MKALTSTLGKLALRILQEEAEPSQVCMKCSAYCVDNCPVQSLGCGCIYLQNAVRAEHQ